MEKSPETMSLKELNQLAADEISGPETPPPSNGKTKMGSLMGGTPDRLSVPKAFKYPERYMSPTDHMISPVSKGLILAKNRRAGLRFPPSLKQPKIQDLHSEEGVGKIEQKAEELQL